ncbi:hypothetical protein [Psychrobacter sanguinis]|uniref:Uncharacterized protein n=1 Tax=Psychrobacter sanguinis TaxID=861445 RepID=A0A844LYH9_9GAMM|nr:hypothetical protein [Psychrobacter sanguinis]MUG31613.1 hypothetical protein [Psychrobacter sanguinis]
MSQVAFSHQFSHRWSNAPQPVKEALFQEFDDIVRLLEAETDLDSFEFTVPDLHEHIEAIYAEVEAERAAARLQAEQLEAERLEAERLEYEKLEAERLAFEAQAAKQHALSQQQAEQAAEAQIEQDHSADNLAESRLLDTASESSLAADSTADTLDTLSDLDQEGLDQSNLDQSNLDQSEIETEAYQQAAEVASPVTADTAATDKGETSKHVTAPDTSTPPAFEFAALKGELDEEFIKGLEAHIDDYLSEQLADMSENLKAWLRDQIMHRLSSK